MGLPQEADAAGAASMATGPIGRSASRHHAGLALSLAGVPALVLYAAAAP
jgi:lipid-binding SYLF domain-containing protein